MNQFLKIKKLSKVRSCGPEVLHAYLINVGPKQFIPEQKNSFNVGLKQFITEQKNSFRAIQRFRLNRLHKRSKIYSSCGNLRLGSKIRRLRQVTD